MKTENFSFGRLLKKSFLFVFSCFWLLPCSQGLFASPNLKLNEFVQSNLAGKSMGGGVIYVDAEKEIIVPFGYATDERLVHSDSVFGLASLSKAFTGTLAAVLDSANMLDLNSLVSDELPELDSSDPEKMQEVRLTQLLTHTSGLPRHDFSFLKRKLSSEAMLANFKYLDFATVPGAAWIYSNLGFFLMQEVIKRKLNLPYFEALQEFLLNRLEIKAYESYASPNIPNDQIALPYAFTPTGSVRLPMTDIVTPAEAAGSLALSLRDIAKWMKFQIGKGNQELVQINQNYQQQPWVGISEQQAYSGYSLGWIHAKSSGEDKTIWHNGGVEGYQTFLSFSPSEKKAVGIFLNSNLAELDEIGMLLYREMVKLPLQQELSLQKPEEPETLTPYPLPAPHTLMGLAGTYSHPAYGEVVVTYESQALSASLNNWFTLTDLIHSEELIFKQQDFTPSMQKIFKIQFVEGGLLWRLESLAPPIHFKYQGS